MVVAAGTAHAHGEKDVGGDVGHLVEDFRPLPLDVDLVVFVGCLPQETGGRYGGHVVREEFVACELFEDEPVERFVGVERVDHVVAIPPGGGTERVLAEAVALGVSRQVEPVPRPTPAVPRIGEQPVDEPFIGIGRGVGDERRHVGRLGRHAEEVERETPNERGPIGLGHRLDPGRHEPREDEPVDRIVDGRTQQSVWDAFA